MSVVDRRIKNLETAELLLRMSREQLLRKLRAMPAEQHRVANCIVFAYFVKCADELMATLPGEYQDTDFRRHAFDLLECSVLDLFE